VKIHADDLTKLRSENGRGRGHYLNSRIELGNGVLDLIRTNCDRPETVGPATVEGRLGAGRFAALGRLTR
jgi:hypothetical protein